MCAGDAEITLGGETLELVVESMEAEMSHKE